MEIPALVPSDRIADICKLVIPSGDRPGPRRQSNFRRGHPFTFNRRVPRQIPFLASREGVTIILIRRTLPRLPVFRAFTSARSVFRKPRALLLSRVGL